MQKSQALIVKFAADIRAAIIEELAHMIQGNAKPTARGRALMSSNQQGQAGQKRPPAVLANHVDRLRSAIMANPGAGIEELGKRLAMPTKHLILPVKKLLQARQILTKGHKRATRYFPR